ncbi:hypothetical protein F4X10_08465 [Candidatus Poribacteria bacterium]|nr:hypothetical protein [Candidatus Poribacteria bacterium]
MFNRFLKILGADPHQYRLLLKTDRHVKARRESSKSFLSDSPALLVGLYAISSTFVSFSAFALDSFSFTLLTLFVSMTMLTFTVISRLEVIINPTDYRTLAHLPVSSRTYFLVKFTHVLLYITVFAGVLNFPPAILGIWSKNAPMFFPVIYFPVSFMAAFFVVGFISAFYGYLIKLYRWERFRNLVAYSQLVLAILVPLCFYLLPRLISIFRVALVDWNQIGELKWVYILPCSWFAGLVHFILGETQSLFSYLAILSVLSTVLFVVLPLGRISLKYAEHISLLLESPNAIRKTNRVSNRLTSFLKNTETRAGFQLVSIYLKRDRNVKVRACAMIGIPLASIIPMIQMIPELMGLPFSIAVAVGVPIYSFYICAFLLSYLLSILKYSEDWKAAWIFTIAPMESHAHFFKGVKLAIIAYFIAPYFIIFTGISVLLWSPLLAVVYMLPSLIGCLCYLSFYWGSVTTLPFSREPREKKGMDDILTFALGLIIFGGIFAIHYVAYQFHIYLYIAVYTLTIGVGVILLKIGEHPARGHPVNAL